MRQKRMIKLVLLAAVFCLSTLTILNAQQRDRWTEEDQYRDQRSQRQSQRDRMRSRRNQGQWQRDTMQPRERQTRQSRQRRITQRSRTHQGQSLLCRAEDLLGSDVKARSNMGQGRRNRDQQEYDMDRVRDNEFRRQRYGGDFDENTYEEEGYYYNDDQWYDFYEEDQNSEGQENIATIQEMVIDDSENKIKYFVLSYEGELVAVPFKALGFRRGDSGSRYRNEADEEQWRNPIVYLKVSRQQLDRAPRLDFVQQINDPYIMQRIDSHFTNSSQQRQQRQQQYGQQRDYDRQRQQQQQQYGQQRDYDWQRQQEGQRYRDQRTRRMSPNVRRRGIEQQDRGYGREQFDSDMLLASELIGLDLENDGEINLGEVEDMVIDTHQGHIAYGLIGFGGFMGFGKDVAIVPWSTLSVNTEENVAMIDATERQIQATVVEEEDSALAMLNQQSAFAQEVHENYGAEPYWQVYAYGFVPGEEQQQQMQDQQQRYEMDTNDISEGDQQRTDTDDQQTGKEELEDLLDPETW